MTPDFSTLKPVAQSTVVPDFATLKPVTSQPTENKSFFRKIGDMLTSSTQKFGTTIGQSIASGGVIESLSQAEQINSQVRLDLTKKIIANKKVGKDTSRLEQALSYLPNNNIQSQISNIVPAINKTTGQVLGEALGTAVEATSGGIISGAKGFGLAKTIAPTAKSQALAKMNFLAKPLGGRLAEIGVNTAKNLATSLPFGYATDVASNLQEGKTGTSVFKPGIGTAVASIIPIGVGGIQATRQIASSGLSNIVAPNLSGTTAKAYDRLRTGNVQQYIGKSNPENVLNEARTAASAFNSTMKRSFGEGKQAIIDEFTNKRIGLNENIGARLTKIAERFGFEDRLPASLQNLSPKETMDVLAEINSIRPISQFDDPLVRSFKLNLADIKKEIMTKAVKEFGGDGGSFEKLYNTYSTKSNMLSNIQSIIGKVGLRPDSIKLNPVQQKTAIQRLQRVFSENADGYLEAIKALEDETGTSILDKVAASQLSNVLPKSLRMPNNLGGALNDVISLVTFPISSPRVGSWIIRKIGGFDNNIVTKILNSNPSVRTAIYNAVNKENMSFNDAVELYAKDYIKNPKLGLSVEDLSKGGKVPAEKIPTTVNNSLFNEAKKYKSAEEFVKAQGETLYHGGTFIKEVSNMRSPWKAFYMSENPTYAKSYGGKSSILNEMVLSKEAKIADLRRPSEELIAQLDQVTKGRITGKTFNIKKPDGSFIGVPEVLNRPNFGSYTQKQVIDGIKQGKAHFAEQPAIKEALKNLGYDGMITQESKFGANYGVWNKNVVKTKSQLTDIWNKANKK